MGSEARPAFRGSLAAWLIGPSATSDEWREFFNSLNAVLMAEEAAGLFRNSARILERWSSEGGTRDSWSVN